MKLLIDFLTLRPVFTRFAIQGIWYVYLFAAVAQLGQIAYYSLAMGTVNSSNYLSVMPSLLSIFVHLALVRIFLEMALHFIDKRTLSV